MNNLFFYAAAISMVLVAMVFAMRPLLSEGKSRHLTATAVAVIVLSAFGLYAIIGRPDLLANEPGGTDQDTKWSKSSATSKKSVGSVSSLMAPLEKRLEENPDDAGGWLLLAKSYKHLGDPEKAKLAYAKAEALGKTDPELSAQFSDDPAESVTRPADAVQIRGSVQLDPSISKDFGANATVFVVAKNMNGAPAPLAVLRRPVSALPFEFVLDDSLSMIKGGGISSAESVTVRAIISESGNVSNQAAEFEAKSDAVDTHNAPDISLTLKQSERSGS